MFSPSNLPGMVIKLSILALLALAATAVEAQWLNSRLDDSTGTVSWTHYNNVNRYQLSFWMGCRGPVQTVETRNTNNFRVPGFVSSLYLYFEVKAWETVNGNERLLARETLPGGGANDGSCWIPPRPQNLPKVGSGQPSNVPAFETRFSGSGRDTRIFFRFISSIYIYELAYSKCGGPWASSLITVLHDGGHTFAQLPDYDATAGYDVIVRALKEDAGYFTGAPYSVVGRGTASNGVTCDASSIPGPGQTVGGITEYGAVFVPGNPTGPPGKAPPAGLSPGGSVSTGSGGWVNDGTMPPQLPPLGQQNPIVVSPGESVTGPPGQPVAEIQVIKENKVISQHPGSSLVVTIDEGGNINAWDTVIHKSLSAVGNCKPGDTLATSDFFSISCTAGGMFRVLQLQPQHPQDRRRDLVVFDAKVTSCYRAYEYLDNGRIEIYFSKC